MDMSGMGGMDMSTAGMFTGVNKSIAHGYWYGLASVVGMFVCVRVVNILQARNRVRKSQSEPSCRPWRPQSLVSQAYAAATATSRELSYSQPIYFTGAIAKYFTPLPIGRWLILALYWAVILTMLWSNTILHKSDSMYAYKWEKVGFRGAWVTVTQIPFVYLLSSKINPLSLLTGISYERLNWLHRWTARTVFLTAIVHWSFFLREWWLADFVLMEIQMMPMVRYGFGAFGILTWMMLSGFGFLRAKAYEMFVTQHIAAAGALLWLLYKHVPSYARYNIFMAIGFVAFDWAVRLVWNFGRNMHLYTFTRPKTPGYIVNLQSLPGDVVKVTVKDVDFSWRAGQHVYLSLPQLRPLELHPFTIANSCTDKDVGNVLTLVIKAHKGFTGSLLKAASRPDRNASRAYRAFLSGPWGMPPRLDHYQTVILVATSTGATFTVPLLESLVKKPGCARNISMHWIVRSHEHMEWFQHTLQTLVQDSRLSGANLEVTIHITQEHSACTPIATEHHQSLFKASCEPKIEAQLEESSIGNDECSSKASMSSVDDEKFPLSRALATAQHSSLHIALGSRPRVEAMIRPPVEAAIGETAIIVCGGTSITAQARTFVAALSDERAVHKGTGAQGIFLFTETYGW